MTARKSQRMVVVMVEFHQKKLTENKIVTIHLIEIPTVYLNTDNSQAEIAKNSDSPFKWSQPPLISDNTVLVRSGINLVIQENCRHCS